MTDKKESNNNLILIIDDQPSNLQVIGKMLKDLGYRIAVSKNADQAKDYLKDSKPDLILLDIILPGMNGFELCRILKQNSLTKDIPVIFLTIKTDPEDIIKGFEVGGADYIKKPFNSHEVVARVKTHVQLKVQRDIQKKLVEELNSALEEVKQLSGLLPICSYCKKIRDDDGKWTHLETYISKHSEAVFSHGICKDCLDKHFPEVENTSGEKNN